MRSSARAPWSFEWVADADADADADTAHGLEAAVVCASARVELLAGASVRMLIPGDEALAGALAMPHVAFVAAGTEVGAAGSGELADVVTARAGDTVFLSGSDDDVARMCERPGLRCLGTLLAAEPAES